MNSMLVIKKIVSINGGSVNLDELLDLLNGGGISPKKRECRRIFNC